MSRTLKDEPYDVKARKLGPTARTVHSYACRYNLGNKAMRIKRISAIFYAHEMKQMEALAAKIEEVGAKVNIKSVNGHLVHHSNPKEDIPLSKRERERAPFFGLYSRGRRLIVDEPKHPNFYAKTMPLYDNFGRRMEIKRFFGYDEKEMSELFRDYTYKVSDFNSFYIYEIEYSYPDPWASRRGNPKDDSEECCPPIIPGWMFGWGCDCCIGQDARHDSDIKTRAVFAKIKKKFNSHDIDESEAIDELYEDDAFNSLKVN